MNKIYSTKMKIFIQILISLLILVVTVYSFNSKSKVATIELDDLCLIDNELSMSVNESIVSKKMAKEVIYYLNIEKNFEQESKLKSVINQVGVDIYQDNKQIYNHQITTDKQWIEIMLDETMKAGILEVRLYAQETQPMGFFSDFIENMKIDQGSLNETGPAIEDMIYFIVSFIGVMFSVFLGIVSLSLMKKQLAIAGSINLYGQLLFISNLYILFSRNDYLISLLVEKVYVKTLIIELLGVLITILLFKILTSYSINIKIETNIKHLIYIQHIIVIGYIVFCVVYQTTNTVLQLTTGINYILLLFFVFPVVMQQQYLRQKVYLMVVFLTPVVSMGLYILGLSYQIRGLTNIYNIGLFITCLTLFVPVLDLVENNINKENQLKNKEKELLQTQVLIMLSQIQPHFLYNTLDSIRYLCKKDPLLASDTILRFSQFLRRNLDSLKQVELVSFEKELEHLQNYLIIEKLRFNERLNIVYNIETSNFKLPSLTVQPLVENCVKYGVTKKREGGTIVIETKETAHFYKIIISDDGIGFDPKQKQDDGRTHIGIDNVSFRLQQQCAGQLTIESKKGIGTKFTIIIPKE